MACPGAPYNKKNVIYTQFTDNRGCSDCTCGAPSAKCVGGKATVSPHANCGGSASLDVPTSCAAYVMPSSAGPIYAVLNPLPTPTGSCAHAGGSPTGSATSAGPMTICCM